MDELLRKIEAARQKRDLYLRRFSNLKVSLGYYRSKNNREKVKELKEKIEEAKKEYSLWREEVNRLCRIWREEVRGK